MNQALFFENFELLADSPNGVQRLRELILKLAVMGKLIPQDPDDEPASVLFEKIEAEKKKLVIEKIIRADSVAQIEEDEILFKIPNSWEWVRLGQIGDWGAGSTPNRRNSDYFGGTIKWFKSGELNDGYITDSEEKITDLALKDCSLRLNKKDDVLIAMYGATIGKIAILGTEATTNQAVCACTCFTGVYNRYLFFLLKAYQQYFTSQGAGGAQPNISRVKIVNTVAPLPPHAEQKRIVSKVEELMALCDKLEARRQKKQKLQSKLNNAALDRMLSTENQEEFEQNWRRICENFDLLYDNPENVEKLKHAILQLAVQGKLVPQNPENKSACVLIEKINDEKKRYAEEHNLREKESLPPVEANEEIFKLPVGWIWSRIGTTFLTSSGTTPKRSNHDYFIDGTENWVKTTDLNNGVVTSCEEKITSDAVKDCSLKYYPIGTVCVAMYGGAGTIGKSGILGMKSTINQSVCGIYPNKYILPEFLHYYVKSIRSEWMKFAAGLRKDPNINGKIIDRMVIPIPPLEEQKRIVEKVEQFMCLCDELEAKLRKEREESEKLMETVVKRLLEGAAA